MVARIALPTPLGGSENGRFIRPGSRQILLIDQHGIEGGNIAQALDANPKMIRRDVKWSADPMCAQVRDLRHDNHSAADSSTDRQPQGYPTAGRSVDDTQTPTYPATATSFSSSIVKSTVPATFWVENLNCTILVPLPATICCCAYAP